MTDLDPEIWNNKTLGAAANNERLDRIERQQLEDRSARLEDREPREIVVDNTYPDWTPEVNERTGTVSSNYQTVHFADENPNDIPVDSRPEDETAAGIQESDGSAEESDVTSEETPTSDVNESTDDESESVVSDQPQEDVTTTEWSREEA